MSHIRVTIIEAKNLKKMDFFTQSDGFVEIYLNNKCKKYRTKVIHNSKNPHWDESVVLNQFEGQDILYVNVYDDDALQKELIGSFTIDLYDLYQQRYIDTWYDIPSKSKDKSHGKLHLRLEYQPLKV